MINRVNGRIEKIVLHHLGKKNDGEDITFSDGELELGIEQQQLLLKYFLDSYKEPDFYQFTFNDGDFVLNPLYNYIGNTFDDPESLYEHSVKVARLLFEKSNSPMIKDGDFCMVYFSDLLIDDEMVDAVGIYKAENKDSFIQIDRSSGAFKLNIDEGININKIDKACLVLNTDRDIGFKILNIDHSNKYKEARYWRDDFLILERRSDDYHSTTDVIRMTAEFVKKRLPAEAPIDKKEQSEILKKTETYFKNNEEFEIENFKDEVFQDNSVASAFEEFRSERGGEHKSVQESFSISEYAVKKQSKVFKSVIKLDKNFHIYVHGDHSKITKGELENGQKYYMLYYEDER